MNSLDSIWDSYESVIASLKVTRRVLNKAPVHNALLVGTRFMASSTSGADSVPDSVLDNVNDLFILAIWSVFEREVRTFVEAEGTRPLVESGFPLHETMAVQLKREIEFWRNDDVLDVLNAQVNDVDLIGTAKQIRQYRDWVAHRNPKRGKPLNVTPRIAYETLSAILGGVSPRETTFRRPSPIHWP